MLESIDISVTAQLAVMIKMVFSGFFVKEELLQILPIEGQMKILEDIYQAFKHCIKKDNVPLPKLVSLITAKAPAIGRLQEWGCSPL